MPTVDVCICTYRRPALLAKLLDSIAEQNTGGLFDVCICVADNDPEGSAESAVEAFSRRHSIEARYTVQPEKNISLTRNATLELGQGEYIAFIDDDEYASPDWLSAFVASVERFRVDGLFGPVERYFDEGTPRFYRDTGMYDQPNPETGDWNFVFNTGNGFMRRAALDGLGVRFDPEYGLTGGEDTELFTRLRCSGKLFLWCREALVYEYIPPARTNLAWILKRNFRIGITTATIWHHHRREQLMEHQRTFPLRFAGTVAGLLLGCVQAVNDPTPFAQNLRRTAFLAGQLAYLAGHRHEEYR